MSDIRLRSETARRTPMDGPCPSGSGGSARLVDGLPSSYEWDDYVEACLQRVEDAYRRIESGKRQMRELSDRLDLQERELYRLGKSVGLVSLFDDVSRIPESPEMKELNDEDSYVAGSDETPGAHR